MYKKITLLLLMSFLLILKSNAQFYSQGDIWASIMPTSNHDSTYCQSTATAWIDLTVSNSFMGDSVIIKDEFTGSILFADVNTTGMNPWNTSYPLYPSTVNDDNLVSGVANFFWPPMKMISGTDTIFNVYVQHNLYVPNPCSYGLVTGKVYVDYNNDCMFNGSDVALSNLITNGFAQVSSPLGSYILPGFTDANGNYSINMQNSWMTSYQVYMSTNYSFIFPSTACSPVTYNFTSLPQANVDFSLQCTSIIDVEASAAHPGNARPSIPFMVHPKVMNTGCDSAAGVLTFVKDPNVTYNASLSTNPATYVNGDTLQWNYANLTNLSNGSYWNSFMSGVYLTPNSTVNIGDTLCFYVSTTVMSNDANAANNQTSFCIPVVNSFDPNVKTVEPKGVGVSGNIPVSTSMLDYTIQFQNTGTAPAYNVYILDTLDADVDPSSLQIKSTSHNMTPEWVSSNVIRFNFYNIMLADSFTNEPASHGQVQYRVKLKSGLPVGTQIKNTAYIYFDGNQPIVTNTAVNTLVTPNGISVVNKNHGIFLYPNPTSDYLKIKVSDLKANEHVQLTLFTLNGQILSSHDIQSSEEMMDVSSLKPGLYFIQIQDGGVSTMEKFIKE